MDTIIPIPIPIIIIIFFFFSRYVPPTTRRRLPQACAYWPVPCLRARYWLANAMRATEREKERGGGGATRLHQTPCSLIFAYQKYIVSTRDVHFTYFVGNVHWSCSSVPLETLQSRLSILFSIYPDYENLSPSLGLRAQHCSLCYHQCTC